MLYDVLDQKKWAEYYDYCLAALDIESPVCMEANVTNPFEEIGAVEKLAQSNIAGLMKVFKETMEQEELDGMQFFAKFDNYTERLTVSKARATYNDQGNIKSEICKNIY